MIVGYVCCLLASLIHRTTLSQWFDCEMKNIFENNDNGDDDDDYLIAYTCFDVWRPVHVVVFTRMTNFLTNNRPCISAPWKSESGGKDLQKIPMFNKS